MTMSANDVKRAPVGELHPLLALRWSPHGFVPGYPLPDRDLRAILEAGRWSMSSSNTQPWRFVVGRAGDEAFRAILGSLTGANPSWAQRASALVVICAHRTAPADQPSWAEYDTGQAAALMTVQAETLGLSAHQMGGFDADRLREEFGLAAAIRPMAVMAIGLFDSESQLTGTLLARELAPRTRRCLDESIIGGWRPHES